MLDRGTSPLLRDSGGLSEVVHPAEIRALTGLRGLLAWWVVLFHLGPLRHELLPEVAWTEPMLGVGDAAVDFFFMLSGFVIELSSRARLTPSSGPAFRGFIISRFARIYPVHAFQQALWFLLVAVAVHLNKPGFASFGLTDFVLNLMMVNAWGVPMKMYWNYPAWSVSLEWAAYLATPLIFTVTRAHQRRASIAVALLALWLILLVLVGTEAGHLARIATQYSAGVLLATLARRPHRVLRVTGLRWLLAMAYVLALPHVAKLGFAYAPLAPLAGLLLVLFSERSMDAGPLSSRVAHYFGRVSYSLYMCHALAISVLHQAIHPSHFVNAALPARVAVALAYCAAVLGLAIASYHLVEEPGRRWLLAVTSRSRPRPTSADLVGESR